MPTSLDIEYLGTIRPAHNYKKTLKARRTLELVPAPCKQRNFIASHEAVDWL